MPTRKTTLSSKRSLLKSKLREGKNLLLTTPDGATLIATVRDGRVQRLDAFSKSGRKFKVSLLRRYEGQALEKDKCYVKYCRKHPDGTEDCNEIEVDCSKIPAPPPRRQ